MTQLPDKIALYTQLSRILFAAGIILACVAVWMFFRFRILRLLDRLTGYGKKREKKQAEKRSRQEEEKQKAAAESAVEEDPLSYSSGSLNDSDEDLSEADGGDEAGPHPASMEAADDAENGSAEEPQAGDEDATAEEGETDTDMSVWDNTDMLEAMLNGEKPVPNPAKTGKAEKTAGPAKRPRTQRKEQEGTPQAPTKQHEPVYGETGLLALKQAPGPAKRRAETNGSDEDPATGVLKQNAAEPQERFREHPGTDPERNGFRITGRHIITHGPSAQGNAGEIAAGKECI